MSQKLLSHSKIVLGQNFAAKFRPIGQNLAAKLCPRTFMTCQKLSHPAKNYPRLGYFWLPIFVLG